MTSDFDAVGFEQALDDVRLNLRRRAEDDGQIAHARVISPIRAARVLGGPTQCRRLSNTTRPPTIVSTGRGRRDLAGRDREDVARDIDEVREVSGPEPPLSIFHELSVGGSGRVTSTACMSETRSSGNQPSAGVPSGELAGDGRVQTDHRIQWRDEPVGPERDVPTPASTNDRTL